MEKVKKSFLLVCLSLLFTLSTARVFALISSPYVDTLTTLARGPYLQQGTPSSLILRWRTVQATASFVYYGTSSTLLGNLVADTSLVKEHMVQLTGLTPSTTYYYSIGSSIQTLQGDSNNYFTTSPITGSTTATSIWVAGDCGTNLTAQRNVRDAYLNYMAGKATDVWLLLGDNAYTAGTDPQFQSGFFNNYQTQLLKKTVFWPAPGNHDYADSPALQNSHQVPYYDIFSVPMHAEAGGVASNSNSYYSFDYGNTHFVSMDSYGIDSVGTTAYRLYDTLGPQIVWLKQDLAANTQRWTIVYWHHPPYSMGSHNSDTEVEMRKLHINVTRILERYKVDLMLTGHSHDYERSHLMKGHYGAEVTFDSILHDVSTSSALYDGSNNSCPYIKNASTNYLGTVYVVSGSAGHIGGIQASFPHAAMYYSDAVDPGSMAIEVIDNKLTSKFICADGVIRDEFTIVKDVNKVVDTTITYGQSITLTSSWPGDHVWSPAGPNAQSVTVTPDSSITYVVTDSVGCLLDTFHINICYPPTIAVQATDTIICSGSDALFYVHAQGSDTLQYQWEYSPDNGLSWASLNNDSTFLNVNSDSLQLHQVAIFYNAELFRCKITNACGLSYTNAYHLTVLSIDTAAVAIQVSSGNNPSCAGNPITFVANGSFGGAQPSYQWMLNGNPVGVDSMYYQGNTFINGDSIVCIYTSNAACMASAVDTSNQLFLTVLPILSPAVTIQVTPSDTVLLGDTLFFAANSTNGGSGVSYQWLVNGLPVGTDSSAFESNSLMDGDIVSCQLTSNAACVDTTTVWSNTIPISVYTVTGMANSSHGVSTISLFPNPFSGKSMFSYTLENAENCDLMLMDVYGHPIRLLFKGRSPKGRNTVQLDNGLFQLQPGMYFIQLHTEQGIRSIKCIIN